MKRFMHNALFAGAFLLGSHAFGQTGERPASGKGEYPTCPAKGTKQEKPAQGKQSKAPVMKAAPAKTTGPAGKIQPVHR